MAQDYALYTPDCKPNTALSVYECGWQICTPAFFYGPATRDHYLIHYIIKGSGEYHVSGRIYKLEQGDAFIIYPNIETFYKANPDDPWEYYWVGFNGTEAKNLLTLSGILGLYKFTYKKDNLLKKSIIDLYHASKNSSSREYAMLGYLYLFFSYMINQTTEKKQKNTESYVEEICKYIQLNYKSEINIKRIANHFHIDRSNVYKIFKETLQVSPVQYLINYRLSMACKLLKTTDLPVYHIAYNVGYKDIVHFTKMFKAHYKITPTEYRSNPFETE